MMNVFIVSKAWINYRQITPNRRKSLISFESEIGAQITIQWNFVGGFHD